MKIKEKVFLMGSAIVVVMGVGVSAFSGDIENSIASALGENKSASAIAKSDARGFSQGKVEAALFDALGEKGSFRAASPSASAFKIPTVQSVESKTWGLRISDSLWNVSEKFSQKDASQFIMEKMNVFDDKELGAVTKIEFSNFKEDYIDDFKDRVDKEKFNTDKETRQIEKIARAMERAERKALKAEEAERKALKAEEKEALKEEKEEEKAEVKEEQKAEVKEEEKAEVKEEKTKTK